MFKNFANLNIVKFRTLRFYHFAGTDWRHPYGPSSSARPEDPVVHVSWRDAQAFCAWDTAPVGNQSQQSASSTTTPTASSSATSESSSLSLDAASASVAQVHKRLPTEVEWELACRGGLRGARFPWGDREHDDHPDDVAQTHERRSHRHRMNIWTGRFPDYNSADDGYAALAPVRFFFFFSPILSVFTFSCFFSSCLSFGNFLISKFFF